MDEKTAIDRAILLLVSGMTLDATITTLKEKLGLTTKKAEAIANKAQKKIILAANYDRTKELGTAIARLNDLYRRAVAIQDTKTALAIQRELNKLMDLYEKPTPYDDTPEPSENNLAKQHLLALGLGDDQTPLPELCRRAAAKIIELTAAAAK